MHKAPEISFKDSVYVQHSEGSSWLHIEWMEELADLENDHPALIPGKLETIWLFCHSGCHAYIHYVDGRSVRCINVGDHRVVGDMGAEESWECLAKEKISAVYAEFGEDFAWPASFDSEMVLQAFKLPASGELEILDICICVSNPDENDMTHALPE